MGKARKQNVSSGVRKANAEKNMPARGRGIGNPVIASFLKSQKAMADPGKKGRELAASMLKDKPSRGPVKKRPEPLAFPLLETLAFHTNPNCVKAVAKLLKAACLTIQPVKRHPGWHLNKTYSMKDRLVKVI